MSTSPLLLDFAQTRKYHLSVSAARVNGVVVVPTGIRGGAFTGYPVTEEQLFGLAEVLDIVEAVSSRVVELALGLGHVVLLSAAGRREKLLEPEFFGDAVGSLRPSLEKMARCCAAP